MVKVENSICHCGRCGSEFPVSWELELQEVAEGNSMEEEYHYIAEEDAVCPNCGNRITVSLAAWEYPIGVLNDSKVRVETDESGNSSVSIPDIAFFDL